MKKIKPFNEWATYIEFKCSSCDFRSDNMNNFLFHNDNMICFKCNRKNKIAEINSDE
jgi:hypothetical protein